MTVMTVDELILAKGSGDALEDRVGSYGGWAWAIDGASGLYPERHFPGASDASWFVDELDRAWRATIAAGEAPREPQELIAIGVRRITERIGWTAETTQADNHFPSAAVALVRDDGDAIAYAVVGDCSLFARVDGIATRIIDRRPLLTERPITAELTRLQSTGASYQVMHAAITPLVRARRAAMNRPGGYYSVDFTLRGVAEARTGTLAGSGKLVLGTDGFTREVDVFETTTDETLADHVLDGALAATADRVRALERGDPLHIKGPRIKAMDDLAAIRLVTSASGTDPRTEATRL